MATMLTKIAAVKLKSVEASDESFAAATKELAKRLTGCGFPAKKILSLDMRM